MNDVIAVILAAGSSSRMGRSKQLLEVNGEPMLRHIVKCSLDSRASHTIAVLGHNEQEHGRVIRDLRVMYYIHAGWKDGIGSSLKAGLGFSLKVFPDMQAILVMVADQPYVTEEHLNKLIESRNRSRTIVASAYLTTVGVPALFDKVHFGALLSLGDDHGAKKVIEQHRNAVEAIEFQLGSMDLDTPDDYRKFKESKDQ